MFMVSVVRYAKNSSLLSETLRNSSLLAGILVQGLTLILDPVPRFSRVDSFRLFGMYISRGAWRCGVVGTSTG